MSEYFEEEEFTTQFNGRVVLRILRLAKPYWTWVAGFMVLVAIIALLDSFFAYLRKMLIDDGILSGSRILRSWIGRGFGRLIFYFTIRRPIRHSGFPDKCSIINRARINKALKLFFFNWTL